MSEPADRKRRRTTDWQERALCAGADSELFFPDDGNSFDAKLICACCEVQGECLDFALTRRESGIWGGLTESERENLKRRERRGA